MFPMFIQSYTMSLTKLHFNFLLDSRMFCIDQSKSVLYISNEMLTFLTDL